MKTALSHKERIQVAFSHHCLGIDQHILAAQFGVNAGRVAEACTAIWFAAEHTSDVNALRKAQKTEVIE